MTKKMSYISGTSDIPLLGITIGDQFDQIVKAFPENEALIVYHQNIRWTYQDLKNQVNTCARALMSIGLEKGDRMGIWSPNCAEWMVTQYAAAKIGAILVNLNPAYRIFELEYALNQSGCKALIIADQFKYSNFTAMVQELIPELQDCEPRALESKKIPSLKTLVRLHPAKVAGMYSWEELLNRAAETPEEALYQRQNTLTFDDPINIQYTSGTTGHPKGVLLSHHNILNNAFFVARIMNFTNKDRLIVPVPLYHCFGMVLGNLGCLTHGATAIYPSEGFDAALVLKAAEQEKATALFGVPTMFIAELEHPDFEKYDLSSFRTGILGAAPVPMEVMKKVQNLMHLKEMQIAYGMTETSPVSTQARVDTPIEKQVSTVGLIHPHLEIKIVNPGNGRVVPIGEQGELCTRGYSVMLGYWNDEVQTKEAIDEARWMHSGDLAVMDEEGYVKIVGRIKDMIIRGGENIYPREIEEFLYTHPKISEVQVIGVPHEKYGEEVMAWIKLHEGETANGEEITEFCKGKIAYVKIPRYFKFTDNFPMTGSGKVRKVEMREISARELQLK